MATFIAPPKPNERPIRDADDVLDRLRMVIGAEGVITAYSVSPDSYYSCGRIQICVELQVLATTSLDSLKEQIFGAFLENHISIYNLTMFYSVETPLVQLRVVIGMNYES